MGRRDREQARDRGNSDVAPDERGRGRRAGREPYQATRDKTEGERETFEEQPGAEGGDAVDRGDSEDEDQSDEKGRRQQTGRADRGGRAVIRPSVATRNKSTTGGKVGRAAERRDRSGEPENP